MRVWKADKYESSKIIISKRLRHTALLSVNKIDKPCQIAAWLELRYTYWIQYKSNTCCPYLPGTAECLVFHIQDSAVDAEDSQFGGDAEKRHFRNEDSNVSQSLQSVNI